MLEPSGDHGLFGEVQGQCRGIRAVHRNCRNETADHVARAFDRGNYSKGSEVDRFQVCVLARRYSSRGVKIFIYIYTYRIVKRFNGDIFKMG